MGEKSHGKGKKKVRFEGKFVKNTVVWGLVYVTPLPNLRNGGGLEYRKESRPTVFAIVQKGVEGGTLWWDLRRALRLA